MNILNKNQLFKLKQLLAFSLLLTLCTKSAFAFDHEHALWSAVLDEVVVVTPPTSQVKYTHLVKKDPRFETYLRQLQAVTKDEFERFSADQQLAFLINTYNAHQIELVVKKLPHQIH